MTQHAGTVEGETSFPIRVAAREAGVAENTLRRLIQDGLIDAVRDGGGLRVTQSTVLELKSGALRRGPGTRSPSLGARESDRARGELAATCFGLFREGKPLISIVEELQVPPTTLRVIWNEWRELQDIERHAVRLECLHKGHGECDGPPQPNIGLCGRHGARTRILTQEQDAILRGREIPKAFHCKACDELAADGVCWACLEGYVIVTVEGDKLVVRVRDQVIAIEDIAGITAQLGFTHPAKKQKQVGSPPMASSLEHPSQDDIVELIQELREALAK